MNKFVGKIVGDGQRTIFDLQHDLNTLDFVMDVRDVNGGHGMMASIYSVGPNVVQITTLKSDPPLAEGETLWVTMIG